MKTWIRACIASLGLIILSCSDAGNEPPPAPVISGIQPATASIGDTVRILGSHFGATRSGASVSFGGVSAGVYLLWSATEIRTLVPAGAASGMVIVTVDGIGSNSVPITIVSSGGGGGVSFAGAVQPILNTGCTLSGCHAPPSPASSFDQTTYAGVRNGGSKFGAAVVVPGDSTNSRILQAMRGTAPGLGRMPFGGPWAATGVPDSLINVIAVWIQQGAMDN